MELQFALLYNFPALFSLKRTWSEEGYNQKMEDGTKGNFQNRYLKYF